MLLFPTTNFLSMFQPINFMVQREKIKSLTSAALVLQKYMGNIDYNTAVLSSLWILRQILLMNQNCRTRHRNLHCSFNPVWVGASYLKPPLETGFGRGATSVAPTASRKSSLVTRTTRRRLCSACSSPTGVQMDAVRDAKVGGDEKHKPDNNVQNSVLKYYFQLFCPNSLLNIGQSICIWVQD